MLECLPIIPPCPFNEKFAAWTVSHWVMISSLLYYYFFVSLWVPSLFISILDYFSGSFGRINLSVEMFDGYIYYFFNEERCYLTPFNVAFNCFLDFSSSSNSSIPLVTPNIKPLITCRYLFKDYFWIYFQLILAVLLCQFC